MLYPGAEDTDRHVVFFFARDCAGVTPNATVLIDDKSVAHLLAFTLLPHDWKHFSFDIIADPKASYCLGRILPTAVGRFRIALGIGYGDHKFVLHQRARISRVQKLPLVRNAGRIDVIVANIKPVETGRDVGDHFISYRFDSDRNIVSHDRSIVLNRKLHKFLTSPLIGKLYQTLRLLPQVRDRTVWAFVLIAQDD
jgi:hypothetical protein